MTITASHGRATAVQVAHDDSCPWLRQRGDHHQIVLVYDPEKVTS